MHWGLQTLAKLVPACGPSGKGGQAKGIFFLISLCGDRLTSTVSSPKWAAWKRFWEKWGVMPAFSAVMLSCRRFWLFQVLWLHPLLPPHGSGVCRAGAHQVALATRSLLQAGRMNSKPQNDGMFHFFYEQALISSLLKCPFQSKGQAEAWSEVSQGNDMLLVGLDTPFTVGASHSYFVFWRWLVYWLLGVPFENAAGLCELLEWQQLFWLKCFDGRGWHRQK